MGLVGMDLQKILREKIDALPDGLHMKGLRSVKLHIDNAAKHFERGHRESDQSLFTDAIYRCNQAFEGSIKEAYCVLAETGATVAEVKRCHSIEA
jgi:hypothetical protein